ncbi:MULTISPECIES: hypothetical protein [Mycolicibacterium]|jgi:hypothetical protein|uniref:Uncharacterized protein n=2 Tax=Mycolicibacterium TaxID=1866885 RepID=A1T4E1_MYCVP|nr:MULTISPECIES: hypothetical protein [Mycolicibacterium]ABM12041.1 hypothetical protein Mvan_1206 [Mycolicibacterium vanbaalenii PYR-1]MCV7130004.1 hypothetical protein [Mycolicibacterium vanbaalenii PYR-1]MDN4516276.1 hypothetical protein [Mycolicibacterium austroafricanum]MDW5613769.1 hypothetical protein [Mycolicibacterium sp. D5.8-2]PQP41239.1 hypothetical protein C6A88_29025 [Mycolicibacterium austroafricanum]
MNTTTVNVTAAVAAGLTAAMFGFAAPAVAAPMPGGDAAETITMLEAEGNRVIVNRLSDTPLDQAEVVSIYRGPALRDTVRDDLYERTYQRTVVGHVYYLDIR